MKSRNAIVGDIENSGIIAVIRAENAAAAVNTCRALAAGGVIAWEVAMTTPGAFHAIEQIADELGDQGIIGVGTVLDAPTAVSAVHAGAQFIFAPTVNTDVIEAAHRYDRAVVPGALTPTEIATAWSAGADVVKLFPANHFGPKYIKDIHGPMPQVRITPTGGVDLDTAEDWIRAGAVALGVGSSLVKKDWIAQGKWDDLSALAAKFVDVVRKARGGE